jgi:hypothetical protein
MTTQQRHKILCRLAALFTSYQHLATEGQLP